MEAETYYEYKILNFELITQSILRLILLPISDGICFNAGQYCQILFENGQLRGFSIANFPNETQAIELNIRINNHNYHLIYTLINRGSVKLIGPFGTFNFDYLFKTPTMFLAEGMGVVPIKSILSYKNIENLDLSLMLFYQLADSEYIEPLIINWKNTYQKLNLITVIDKTKEDSYLHFMTLLSNEIKKFLAVNIYTAGSAYFVSNIKKIVNSYQNIQINFYSDI